VVKKKLTNILISYALANIILLIGGARRNTRIVFNKFIMWKRNKNHEVLEL